MTRSLAGRAVDRRLSVAGIGLAIGYLLAAGLSLLLPEEGRRGLWLPLHLAFLGGGGVAIVAVLPFFAASLSAVQPAPPGLRRAGIALTALGAAAVSGGAAGGSPGVALVGGLGVLAGIGATAVALLGVVRALPSGRASDRARVAWAASLAGLAALACLALGGLLAILFLAGSPAMLGLWPTARIAHAWFNLFGFVGLVVVSTLLHLLPTVFGTRVGSRGTGLGAVVALGLGAVVGGGGFLVRSDALVRLGALSLLTAAVLLSAETVRVWRARGRWTTDAGWHRFAIGSLLGGVAWFVVALVAEAARTLAHGASPAAWELAGIVAPLAGWLGSTLLGAASHLVPSIGPGGPSQHAAARRLLGTWAIPRLLGFHGGLLLVSLGGWVEGAAELGGIGSFGQPLGAVGLAGFVSSAGVSAVLLGRAVLLGWRSPSGDAAPPSGPPSESGPPSGSGSSSAVRRPPASVDD